MSSIAGDLRLKLEQLADHDVTAGSKTPEVIAAMDTELRDMRRAYNEDPDPAGEPGEIDEPANDWPAPSLDQTGRFPIEFGGRSLGRGFTFGAPTLGL